MEKTKETMASYSIRLPSELYERIMDATTRLDLRSKNDFVRDACKFYLEWLSRESSEKFITPALESVVRGTVRDSESRIVRQLFRLAVEMNVHNHLLAEYDGIGDYDFEKLRISATSEINREMAKNLFENAYSQGNVQASYLLGKMLLEDGDTDKALDYLCEASEQSDLYKYRYALLCYYKFGDKELCNELLTELSNDGYDNLQQVNF